MEIDFHRVLTKILHVFHRTHFVLLFIDEVNEILLRPESQQWGRYGSSVLPDLSEKDLFSNSCFIREGDYDFTVQSLVRSVYLGSTSDEVLLFPEIQKKVMFELLPS